MGVGRASGFGVREILVAQGTFRSTGWGQKLRNSSGWVPDCAGTVLELDLHNISLRDRAQDSSWHKCILGSAVQQKFTSRKHGIVHHTQIWTHECHPRSQARPRAFRPMSNCSPCAPNFVPVDSSTLEKSGVQEAMFAERDGCCTSQSLHRRGGDLHTAPTVKRGGPYSMALSKMQPY